VEVVASLSQGRTAAAQCGLFTRKSVLVIFEPPCTLLNVINKIFPYLLKASRICVEFNTRDVYKTVPNFACRKNERSENDTLLRGASEFLSALSTPIFRLCWNCGIVVSWKSAQGKKYFFHGHK